MGLATIDPHSQKEHTKSHKIPNLQIYKEMYGNTDMSGQESAFVRISIHFFVNFFRF